MSISGIQNMCLLSLARNATQELRGDRTWIHCGALIRSAMSIGLHRDPAKMPSIPAAQGEIRRRLWATVRELVLDSCIEAGGPPLISRKDFDCAPPMNLDDSQLDFNTAAPAIEVSCPRPEEYTDTSL
jgi:hypothetical protein